jgi:hypothetical protein
MMQIAGEDTFFWASDYLIPGDGGRHDGIGAPSIPGENEARVYKAPGKRCGPGRRRIVLLRILPARALKLGRRCDGPDSVIGCPPAARRRAVPDPG